jgi:hypothetical protein
MLEAVRKAYFDHLRANLSVPVYSRVPDEARPPFVVISAIAMGEAAEKNGAHVPVTVNLLVVEAGRSPARTDQLTWNVVSAVQQQDLGIASPYSATEPSLVSASTTERGDGDGKLWVGEIAFTQMVSH